MMRSLFSGVAGLKTHQTKMDVIGNNIANVNTTSFKSQSITFTDTMYQTTQAASGATETKGGINARQIGLGTKSGAIATAIESQGATQTTNNPFDIMITGDAFFVVNNGIQNLFTRDGSFYVDGAGNLAMQANGYFVMGWAAQEDPETGEITVNKNGGLTNLQLMNVDNTTYSPASTTAGLFSGNIDDNDTNVTSDDGKTITLEFYDNKGYLYTGKFVLKDTGTEDLFSIQLTDIIDSNGNTIGKELLDGISFGTTETSEIAVDDAYDVTVSSSYANIKLLAGATVYENVPMEGTLYSLMNASKTALSGILEDAYGISDAMVNSGQYGYSKTSTYSISEDGIMTITYPSTDYNKKITSADGHSYSFTATNSSDYYIATDGSMIGYAVPGKAGSMSGIATSTQATLNNVFTNFTDDATTYNYLGSNSPYKYVFKSNSSGSDVFAVYQLPGLEYGSGTATSFAKYENNCFISDGTGEYATLADLDSAMSGMTMYYDYTESNTDEYKKELKIYPATSTASTDELLEAAGTAQRINIAASSTSELLEDVVYTYNSLNTEQKTELAALLSATNVISDNTVSALDAYISSNSFTHLKVTDLTGTSVIMFYQSAPAITRDTTRVLYSGRNFYKEYLADESTYNVDTPDSVFKDSTTGSAYVLAGDYGTVGDLSQEFLQNVFQLDIDIPSNSNLLVKFSTAGAITIYHNATQTPNLNTDYATQLQANGQLKYVTTNDTSAYEEVPLQGNISDLLQTATGTFKNLLYKVYNISDEDADAYGTDGTYAFNSDGSLNLTTGTQTIQLKFDPASGALKSANGNENGLVNLTFNQKIEGLESFGFQPVLADDAAKAGQMTLDFSTVTNYNTSGSSTIKAVKGDKKSLNTGRMVGEMNGITIATDGQVNATYSNGQTKLLGQIASAEFANASGLSKEGDNLYSQTLNSGEATIQDITTDGGYMNTGVLEMSNVDLSTQFTEMITTQRGFQANSRIITVSDTLLEELTNLKR
ncbi:MAG: flagellar hook-basal body complex protein [Butyrivibrio sp.]|nr:flagellar hook-basal body complex protein [Butyrivibrio sp.]